MPKRTTASSGIARTSAFPVTVHTGDCGDGAGNCDACRMVASTATSNAMLSIYSLLPDPLPHEQGFDHGRIEFRRIDTQRHSVIPLERVPTLGFFTHRVGDLVD